MMYSEIFSRLVDANIKDVTSTCDGKKALPIEYYRFVSVVGPAEEPGFLTIQVKKYGRLIEKDVNALYLLELVMSGKCAYYYEDKKLATIRSMGNLSAPADGCEFIRSLTIL